MRIVIDGRMLSWTGIGRYTAALLEGLEAIDRTNEYVVLMRQDDWARWKPQEANFRRVECNIDPYSPAEQTTLPKVLRDLAPDVVHFVTPNAAALYRGTKVVTVHDLTLLDFDTSRGSLPKRLAGKAKRLPFRLIFQRQLATATRIVTDTGYVRDQLIERFGLDPAKVSAVWIAADSAELTEAREETLDGVSASDSLILYVGNYFPYKNVRVLIEALALVARSRPDVKLVLAGKAGDYQEGLLALAESLNVADRVVMPGFISDGQLTWLYRNSAMYVYPSLSEGFGLQGLEAMAQGLPVVSSTATCLPEVYGDAAVYFDPHAAGDLAQKIAELLSRPELAAEMAARGRARLPLFSWRATAEATHQIYLDAAQQ
ncbi:glycosyltransferase family 4 protein [Paractinoplanes toevensis]|uniref:Glycosyl transferase family 1 n=1 Tax=Paractinoplanes toevensis TaxID=571911 RepID=A0A919TH25_9ACTN|nr:glycosyltransferase family 1 protein [Actinoplanes toevensis]GIM95415.1 glycosyl transferase family 1 [Actinoplanes toevensis]